MDKALKSSLGWLICGIAILGVIYIYNFKKDSPNNEDFIQIKTKASITRIDTIQDGSFSKILLSIEFEDKDGTPHYAKIAKDNDLDYEQDSVYILYNPNNPEDITLSSKD